MILKELIVSLPSLFPVSALNCVKTPSIWPECARTLPALVGAPVQLAQRLSFHVQLHLRIFFEDLRIPLPEQLRLKFVINSTSA